MHWHSHFQAAFFDTWGKAGLPQPEKYLKEYTGLREKILFNDALAGQSIDHSPALEKKLLDSVYGFGVMTGNLLAEMLGSPFVLTGNAAEWCGRFNLGISLFDYVCDEMDGATKAASLEVFQTFISGKKSGNAPSTPVEALLSSLAASILHDPEITNEKKTGILSKTIKKMFAAEIFISSASLSAEANLPQIKKALYLKSAEPFRLMAEMTSRKAGIKDPLVLKNMRRAGQALGNCYWLIDDAKDLWADLDAGRWNIFLMLAASGDPRIFLQQRDAFTDNRLLKIWEGQLHAQKTAKQIIQNLVKAVARMDIPKSTEQHVMGLIGASLWQWYN